MYDVFHHISFESEVDGQLDVQENVDKLNSDISIDSSTYKLISHLTIKLTQIMFQVMQDEPCAQDILTKPLQNFLNNE